MDESLSEFKHKKRIAGPKSQTGKTKQNIKRIKGQKDIRSVLKPKKTELQSYSKEFDLVCKHSGIDIDPEQLQLALALSKSLQDCPESNIIQSPLPSTSQERIKNIRKTLLEYGFKVPDIKITKRVTTKSKKIGKHKLLHTSEALRRQAINDKYSQVLFETNNFSVKDNLSNSTDTDLYYKATSIAYDVIKSDRVFYVEKLIEQNPNSTGCLLRDWSLIPGRPASPEVVHFHNMNLSEIECSQSEIDHILSGTLKTANFILKSKHKCSTQDVSEIKKHKSDVVNVMKSKLETPLQASQQRSLSPDIFSEDVSIVVEHSQTDSHTISHITMDTNKGNSDFMDITDCVNTHKLYGSLSRLQYFKDSNLTVKLNDSMEITKCVGSLLQHSEHSIEPQKYPVNEHNQDQNIGTINVTDNSSDVTISSQKEGLNDKNCTEQIDLTKCSDSDDDTLPYVHISGSLNEASQELVADSMNSDKLKNANLDSKIKINDLVHNESLLIASDEMQTSQGKIIDDNCRLDKNPCNGTVLQDHILSPSPLHLFDIIEVIKNNEDGIDLTQSSDTSVESLNTSCVKHCYLGRQQNISIDYDELDENTSKLASSSVQKTIEDEDVLIANTPNKEIDISICKNTVELNKPHENYVGSSKANYSLQKTIAKHKNENVDLCNISACNYSLDLRDDSVLPGVDLSPKKVNNTSTVKFLPLKEANLESTHSREPSDNIQKETPLHSNLFVKTNNVTPMLNYSSMSTPQRNIELDKYGLKPFKRKRAIQLLTHIYNQTHPIVDESLNVEGSPLKKHKNGCVLPNMSPTKSRSNKPQLKGERLDNVENDCNFDNIYVITTDRPTIKDIACDPSDWIFQKREKAKIHSCQVPLHIAFHNYVSCRSLLKDSILRYEPVNIDLIHKQLIEYGHRYDPKDLLKFMDRKCITVKTVETNSRSKRR